MGAADDIGTKLAERERLRHDAPGGADGLVRRLAELADGHPSNPGYAGDRRPADGRALTDVEHAERLTGIRARLADAVKAGLTTDRLHTIDLGHEVWSDERDALHKAIVDDLYGAASQVPCEHSAILIGGLAGAGKTTVLLQHPDIDLSRYLVINPDDIKKELAERGMVPEIAGLAPMEAAQLAHEESSHIAKRLACRAQADGRNLIWDITMASGDATDRRIDLLRAAGYTRIEGVFVDIPIETSLRRADARHRDGHDEFQAGRGLGGRHVPADLITAQADPEWGSVNRRHFEQLKSKFDAWTIFDNSADGAVPVRMDLHRPDDQVSKRWL